MADPPLILVVDDEQSYRDALSVALQREGFLVETAADGPEAIASMIGAVQQQFPEFSFRLAGPVDGHHNQARFGWELGPAGSPAPIVGFDVAVSDDYFNRCGSPRNRRRLAAAADAPADEIAAAAAPTA